MFSSKGTTVRRFRGKSSIGGRSAAPCQKCEYARARRRQSVHYSLATRVWRSSGAAARTRERRALVCTGAQRVVSDTRVNRACEKFKVAIARLCRFEPYASVPAPPSTASVCTRRVSPRPCACSSPSVPLFHRCLSLFSLDSYKDC